MIYYGRDIAFIHPSISLDAAKQSCDYGDFRNIRKMINNGQNIMLRLGCFETDAAKPSCVFLINNMYVILV